MSGYDNLMRLGHEGYVNGFNARGTHAGYNHLIQGISYTLEASNVTSDPEEKCRAYSQMVEIYLEMEEPDMTETYISLMEQINPDTIFAYLQRYQLACLRYGLNRQRPRYFTFSNKGETGQTIRRWLGSLWDGGVINYAVHKLLTTVKRHTSEGKINAGVYIAILDFALGISLQMRKAYGLDDPVQDICRAIRTLNLSAYEVSTDDRVSLRELQIKAQLY